MNPIDRTEKIDAYLSGQMPSEERKEFERLLSANANSLDSENLSDEMKMQKEIIQAIRERGLREQLQEQEKQMRADRARKQRFIRLSGWSIGTFSMVAALCIAFVLVPIAQTMVRLSTNYAQGISLSPSRGGTSDSPQAQLEQVYSLVLQERWSEAAPIAHSLMEPTAVSQDDLTPEECQEIYEQAQWLYTLCEMHQKHIFRAKHLLRQIAAGGGHYAEQAQAMLNAL